MIRGWYANQVCSPDFNIKDMPIGQTDLTRAARGMLGGQFWSAFVPWYGAFPLLDFYVTLPRRATDA
jgi:hypothetical protein